MKKIALIPARIESKRFYGKLLEKLSGVPIILRTYQSALETNVFDDVFVVTHNDEIIDLMKSINGKYLKSSSDHESGTDRIAEVSIDLQYDIIVNLQGDEPFIDKLSIEKLVNEFNDKEVQMASLMRNFNDKDELNNPNNVKVIVDKDYYSINFSRIPMNSDTDNYKHIGVYAFRKETLIEFSKMEKTIMEKKEKIECLRYIENGKKGYNPGIHEKIKTCRRHFQMLVEYYDDRLCVNLSKKHFSYYFKGFSGASIWRKKIMRTNNSLEINNILKDMEYTFQTDIL